MRQNFEKNDGMHHQTANRITQFSPKYFQEILCTVKANSNFSDLRLGLNLNLKPLFQRFIGDAKLSH